MRKVYDVLLLAVLPIVIFGLVYKEITAKGQASRHGSGDGTNLNKSTPKPASAVPAARLPCYEHADLVALDKIKEAIEPTWNDIEVEFHQVTSQRELDDEQYRLNCVRDWLRGLKDDCMASAYQEWLDYYQRELNEAKNEFRSHQQEIEQSRYESDTDKKYRAIHAYERTHQIPTPPRCEIPSR